MTIPIPKWKEHDNMPYESGRKPARNPSAKRIDIVSLKMVREASLLYARRSLTSPDDAFSLLCPLLEDNDRETFITLCLDTKNQPTHIQTVSIGTLSASLCHPREIFKTCILSNGATLLCAHNHPSGDPTPSQEDISVTARLANAGRLLGIELLDHIIIGSDGRYVSMRERGLLAECEQPALGAGRATPPEA
ncbi:MAG: JAB domain-containing protein [Bacilli bacterium]